MTAGALETGGTSISPRRRFGRSGRWRHPGVASAVPMCQQKMGWLGDSSHRMKYQNIIKYLYIEVCFRCLKGPGNMLQLL